MARMTTMVMIINHPGSHEDVKVSVIQGGNSVERKVLKGGEACVEYVYADQQILVTEVLPA